MTRQLERASEDRQRKKERQLWIAVDGGIDAAIQALGKELLGFAVKLHEGDCLITVRVDCRAGREVCFVGAADLPSCFLKLQREARGNQLTFRADRFAKK